MERAAWLERRFGARIEWQPYYLHPEYPPEGIPRSRLEERYGKGIHAHTQKLIEGAGFIYDPPETIPNTLPSLLLAELARDGGAFEVVHRALFTAYWSDGKDISDPEVLGEIAEKAGLKTPDLAEALTDQRHTSRIIDSTNQAHSIGVTGVPAWLIDDRILVMGAQPHEAFERVLEELGYTQNAA